MYAITNTTHTNRYAANTSVVATVDSLEAAREFLATAFVNTPLRASLVDFEIDTDNDAADAFMSNSTIYSVERI